MKTFLYTAQANDYEIVVSVDNQHRCGSQVLPSYIFCISE